MQREVKLSRLRELLATLEYPISKQEAREDLEGVTVLYADGQEPLEEAVARSTVDRFKDAEDLESELYTHLPIEAVGEPGQSEGDS